jgi:tetratricopeptide (TPR) repeat protein
MKLGLGLGLILACAFAASSQLPEECKPPAFGAQALRDHPSAKVYEETGAWFAEQGDLRCALAAFEEAVRLEPRSAQAHYDVGIIRARAQQLPAAVAEFRLALQYRPAMVMAHNSLASALLDMGKPAEAEAEFREALKLDSKSVVALDHLARQLASERRYAPATRYWKQALALQPDSPEIVLSLGIAAYQSGDANESIRLLSELLKDHPDMKSAHLNLGNVYSHESRFREAAVEYTDVIRLDARDDAALLAKARALVAASAFQEARTSAEEYVGRKPSDPEGHLLLGSVEKGLSEYTLAEAELKSAAEQLPDDEEAQYQLGFVLARNRKPREALPYLEKAVALKSSDSQALSQLAAVLRELGDTARLREVENRIQANRLDELKIKQLAKKRELAGELLRARQPATAAAVYHQMLEIEPGNARTEYNLALALEAAHDPKGQREALERAIRLDAKMAPALGDLGRLYLAAGNNALAENRLRAAIAADPQLVSALGNLGIIHANKGDNEESEKLFRQAIEDDPSYEQGHVNLGLILARQQKFTEAEAEVDQAMKLAPEDPAALAAAGRVKARLGKSLEGVALLRKAIALAPQSATMHLDLGMVLAESYDLTGALAETGEAVRLVPGSALAHLNHGRVLFDLGRNGKAQADLEIASRIDPQMPEPYYFLAMIEKQAGHYQRAAALLQTVVKLQPHNATAWHLLGQSLENESQTQAAIAAWRKAVAIEPDYSQALWSLARALKPVVPDEAARFMARYTEVQKKRRIVDEAGTLGNDALASGTAHDWPEAIRQFQKAIEVCGACALKADLHKKLGLTDCQMGDLENGEKELRLARALKPADLGIEQALRRIVAARNKRVAPSPDPQKAH